MKRLVVNIKKYNQYNGKVTVETTGKYPVIIEVTYNDTSLIHTILSGRAFLCVDDNGKLSLEELKEESVVSEKQKAPEARADEIETIIASLPAPDVERMSLSCTDLLKKRGLVPVDYHGMAAASIFCSFLRKIGVLTKQSQRVSKAGKRVNTSSFTLAGSEYGYHALITEDCSGRKTICKRMALYADKGMRLVNSLDKETQDRIIEVSL